VYHDAGTREGGRESETGECKGYVGRRQVRGQDYVRKKHGEGARRYLGVEMRAEDVRGKSRASPGGRKCS